MLLAYKENFWFFDHSRANTENFAYPILAIVRIYMPNKLAKN